MATKLISFVGKHIATQIIGLTVARQLSRDLGKVVLAYVIGDDNAAESVSRFKQYIVEEYVDVTVRVLQIPNLSEPCVRHHLVRELAGSDECYVNITGGSRWLTFICAEIQLNPPVELRSPFKILYVPQSKDHDHCDVIVREGNNGLWENRTIRIGPEHALPAIAFLKSQLKSGLILKDEPKPFCPGPVFPVSKVASLSFTDGARVVSRDADSGKWFTWVVCHALDLAMKLKRFPIEFYVDTKLCRSSRQEHGDFDLWFVRGSRLWVFECKYRSPASTGSPKVNIDQFFKELIMTRQAGGAESHFALLANKSFAQQFSRKSDLEEGFGIPLCSVDVDDPDLTIGELSHELATLLKLEPGFQVK